MKTNKLMLFSFAAVVGLCFAPRSYADNYTVDLQQTATNITATGSGSINLSGLTAVTPNPTPDPAFFDVIAGQSTPTNTGLYFLSNGNASETYTEYTGNFSGASSAFGSGTASEIGSGTGDYVGINTVLSEIFVPMGYMSGASLSSTATFNGQFSTLGLKDGTSFTYDLGNGSTFTINVGNVAATPEPGSLVLLGTGLLGFAGVVRRRLS